MHLVIINASPRVETKSNTARIIRIFVRGYEAGGNTTEVWHLSDKKQWEGAKEAYEKNSNVLFAILAQKCLLYCREALAKPASFGAERHIWKCYRRILTVNIMER